MAFGTTNTNGFLAAELDAHIANKNNPHGVTAEGVGAAAKDHTHTPAQVGLGNVPNVTTNNQAPTYTVAQALAALSSGEVLSAAFGKLAKAVNDLMAHIANKANPHGVTAADIGGAARIQTGSYVGTGTYGEQNPCSLTFDFVPKLVWLSIADSVNASVVSKITPEVVQIGVPLFVGSGAGRKIKVGWWRDDSGTFSAQLAVSFNLESKQMSYYAHAQDVFGVLTEVENFSPDYQFNRVDVKYEWLAIG